MPGIVADPMRAHPRLSVDVRLSVDYVDLRQGKIDVALRAWPLDDASDLFAVRLGQSTTGCYASPASFAEPRVAEGRLVPVLQRYWPKVPLHAAHAGANPPPLKVRAFIALARKAVARKFPVA